MESLFIVLELAREGKLKKVYWPAASPRSAPPPEGRHPQHTIAEPTTVYGISKLAGEGWCHYYQRYGVDVPASDTRPHRLEERSGRWHHGLRGASSTRPSNKAGTPASWGRAPRCP